MIADSTLKDFVEQLAARTPTPGGGSAAAVGGAIGAALSAMAGVYTTGEKFAAQERAVRALLERFAGYRARFLELADADIAAYGSYSAARALPKNTPEEKAARSAALKAANEASTRVPEQIVALALEALGATEELAAIANPNLAGDITVAAAFLEAAARGAGIQALGNCAADDAEGRNRARRAAVRQALAELAARRERTDRRVLELLKVDVNG